MAPDSSKSSVRPSLPPRCPACGHVLQLVWVHGHGQCRTCHTNVEPCCSGAPVSPACQNMRGEE